jgi:hypothetical protein
MRQLISRAWLADDVDKLRMLHATGSSLMRASAALNRPMASVKKRARELGLHFAGVREIRRDIKTRELSE